MYIKPEFLRRQMSIDLDDTEKFDKLPEKGLSAGLILKIDCPTVSGQHYLYSNAGDKWRLVDWFTAIQVLTEGKRPLKDMGGAELQAAEYWNSGKTAVDQIGDRTWPGGHCLIPISWGRYLGDVEYYLNWGNYESIELDITNILDDTLHTSVTIDIINLKIVDAVGIPASKGVFQERIWRTWNTVQDERKYFKLPVGSPLRRILLRGVPDQESSFPFRRSCDFYDIMEEIKLKFGDGGEVALDTFAVEQIELMHMLHYGQAHTGGYGKAPIADETGIRTGISRARSKSLLWANVTTTAQAYDLSFYTYMDDLQVPVITVGASQEYISWDIWGLGYNNAIPIPFDLGGIEHILDTLAKAPIDLEVKTGDDSTYEDGQMQIILSELVSR